MSDLPGAVERALAGGPEHHRTKAGAQGKLPVRERVERLLDAGSFSGPTAWSPALGRSPGAPWR